MLPYDSADKNVGIKQSQGTMACIQPLPLEKKIIPFPIMNHLYENH